MQFMQIRPYQAGDAPALFEIFQTAIHQTAAADYTAEQRLAWAPPDRDPQAWAARMDAIMPWVLINCSQQPLAYASLNDSGYIDHFFVHGQHARQGLGALLMQYLLAQAQAKSLLQLSADVSRTAQPFFAHYGFTVVQERFPVRDGIVIPNTLMHKLI